MSAQVALALMGAFAFVSALSLASGVLVFFMWPERVAFHVRGQPVLLDVALGFGGMCGCFGSSITLCVASWSALLD